MIELCIATQFDIDYQLKICCIHSVYELQELHKYNKWRRVLKVNGFRVILRLRGGRPEDLHSQHTVSFYV